MPNCGSARVPRRLCPNCRL
ncbi:MAG: hypothetical protein IK060_02755 [Methanomicrobium sp.]|nr:hypothetical protein [Methanomicrobium sp.]MBR6447893.1 hypothetical protein [Methanomicrobium sp.]